MYKVLPLFKSHYSLGRSILTLEKPSKTHDVYPSSIFDLLIANKLSTLPLVEDNVSCLLQASKVADENNIKLIFGLRLTLTEDCLNQDEESLKKRAKYIIFAKNTQAYKDLIKIWTFASTKGFYYNACLDFKVLESLWTDNLILAVPFYDSFIYLNRFCSHKHVPQIEKYNPLFLLEDNDLPFDDFLKDSVNDFCSKNESLKTLPAQSIYYKDSSDFLAYLSFRCIQQRGFVQKATLNKPDLDHMGSDTFNFKRWLDNEKR